MSENTYKCNSLSHQANINDLQKMLSFEISPEMVSNLDARRLDKVLVIGEEPLKIPQEKLTLFCESIDKYYEEKKSFLTIKPALNALSRIFFITTEERLAVQDSERTPQEGIFLTHSELNIPKFKNIIEFVNSLKMHTVVKCVSFVIETAIEVSWKSKTKWVASTYIKKKLKNI
ncbi:hypothetical protein RF11_01343 [Thelohanellus kitauei]|uniref:Uncharacterized protein n=1 Tax=Thelohanellus kitauei TaxID=669202 RepID=A0A0C2N655_THEKT|nr:hypothetical protein RF11_01343 [Thelohanellus kitauei]